MYAAFISESGNISLNSHYNYVITAILIREAKIDELTQQMQKYLEALKEEYELDTIPTIGGQNIYRGRKGFQSLEKEVRKDIIYFLCDFISGLDLEILSLYYEKEKLSTLNKQYYRYKPWIQQWLMKIFLEKICLYGKQNSSSVNIVFKSRNPVFDSSRMDLINLVLNGGSDDVDSGYLEPEYLEGFKFETKKSEIHDLANFCAWLIHRFFYQEFYLDEEYEFLLEVFNILSEKFATTAKGQIEGFGLKIWPEPEGDSDPNWVNYSDNPDDPMRKWFPRDTTEWSKEQFYELNPKLKQLKEKETEIDLAAEGEEFSDDSFLFDEELE